MELRCGLLHFGGGKRKGRGRGRGGGEDGLLLNPLVGMFVVFGPVCPRVWFTRVFRTEELSERRRAHSVDHAGFEVEEIRARYVHAARGSVVKHVEVELRVVVAAVLAVAPDAVLVAQHLLNRGAHMVTRTSPPVYEQSRAPHRPACM